MRVSFKTWAASSSLRVHPSWGDTTCNACVKGRVSSGDRAHVDVTELHVGFAVVPAGTCGTTCGTAAFHTKLRLENITWGLKMEGGECLTMIKCLTSVLLQCLKYKVVLKSLSRH